MKVSQYNSIYDFPSNPSQKLMFNAKSLALALVDCSKVEQYENYCQTQDVYKRQIRGFKSRRS